MHKSIVLKKQLPTAVPSCFSTILSSSLPICNPLSPPWRFKMHQFSLAFPPLLKIERFSIDSCEKVMQYHVKNNEKEKQLPTAVASCISKTNPTLFHRCFTIFFHLFFLNVKCLPFFITFFITFFILRAKGPKQLPTAAPSCFRHPTPPPQKEPFGCLF